MIDKKRLMSSQDSKSSERNIKRKRIVSSIMATSCIVSTAYGGYAVADELINENSDTAIPDVDDDNLHNDNNTDQDNGIDNDISNVEDPGCEKEDSNVPTAEDFYGDNFLIVKSAFEANSGLKADSVVTVRYVSYNDENEDVQGILFAYAKGHDFWGNPCLIELGVEIKDESNMLHEFLNKAMSYAPCHYYQLSYVIKDEDAEFSFFDNYWNSDMNKECRRNVSAENIWVATIKRCLVGNRGWIWEITGMVLDDELTTVEGSLTFKDFISSSQEDEFDIIRDTLEEYKSK